MDIFCFWGKAQPRDPDNGAEWHPLAFHSLDVAAVGEALLTRHHGLGGWLPHLLGLPREDALHLVRFLLCLHDVGKFAKKFQAKVPDLYRNCFDDDPARLAGVYDHGAGGLRLFDADGVSFQLPDGDDLRVWRPLLSAVAGHHGTPPEPRMDETAVTLRSDFGARGIEAARAFICQAQELFSLPATWPPFDRDRVRRASFALAGLAVLADWIGSNQEWFPYCKPTDFDDLDAYWCHAQKQANDAVEAAGVLPAASISDRLGYEALIGAKATPSPMQAWAREEVELPTNATLFMIEDETGSGKTEAALMLAHRLMAAGRADGLYIALPTMATANAMFDRLSAAHRKLFAADAIPSIALAHGARYFHQGFRSVVLRGGRDEARYSGAGGPKDESEITASAACAAWIADDRRLAFLADVGAGTLDQALLSVLPSRHQSLRLLGLARNVLILDEVHAYDAYMQREIETLLEFQAGLGGSAILLSATLPLVVRRRLSGAFSKGLGNCAADRKESADSSMDYPLATVCATGVHKSTKVMGQSGRARALPVRLLKNEQQALDAVEQAARADKAVLYLRNTVDDALDAHAALTARGLRPSLFHARFALSDRLEIEKRVVSTFGKASEPDRRAGKVLIATQVVEQSLDLDFDSMISDLAPIDLLIQRAGRLWRHRRERKGHPELLVVTPPPVSSAGEDWFKIAFPRAAYVYRNHARLWLTARMLEEAGVIESPGGLRRLIEAVYGDEAEARIPSGLMANLFEAEGRAGAERSVAKTNVLALAKGYVRDGGIWDSDVRTPTRLADDPQVTLRLARVRGAGVEPYANETAPDEQMAWRLSELNVSTRRVSGEAVPSSHAKAARAAKADWTRYDEDKVLVVLEDTGVAGEALVGSALSGTADPKTVSLSYDSQRGLIWDGIVPR